VKLYRNARLFVFPSLYEGFGLPVLEALQCGCPVLLSNNSSLPEVGGNAAFYFDPMKKGELQTVAKDILDNQKKITQKNNSRELQLKKFSWDITTQEHIKVYKHIVQ